jgi:hypothetical protein
MRAGPTTDPDGGASQDCPFEIAFATIARWRDGKIVEEYLKYDNASFMQQLGLA